MGDEKTVNNGGINENGDASKASTTEESSPKYRIARYDQYFDLRTFSDTLRKTAKPADKKHNRKKHVLVVRRIIDYKGQLDAVVLDIKSPQLCEVLQEINKDVEGLRLNRVPPSADPDLFYHSRRQLQARYDQEQAKPIPDPILVADLAIALHYIQEDHGADIADFDRLTSHNEITYDLLWALFPPNSLVYLYHELTEQVQLLLVRSVEYRIKLDKTQYLSLSCNVVTSDGKSFGMAWDDRLEIIKYVGARKITDLPVYPLTYAINGEKWKQHAIERGKRFVKMVGPRYFEISGPAMREVIKESEGRQLRDKDVRQFKFNTYGRVMIDTAAFRTFEPNCTYNLKVYKRLDRDVELTDEEYAICNPVVLGFCFGVKLWGGFPMDRLQDIKWSAESFDSLVLGDKQKSLIRSLVKQHKRRAALFDDIVVGKGKGLIGLLSGNPGCGKTLTAEAVAEITHRPLYVVSAGELGTDPAVMDKSLTNILELAKTWDAVLLLDEAEVFLQRRNLTNVDRNALVSIFLRQLEYYQGILILTTNLIAHCDPAFESRIHFSIHYPDLGFDSRKEIWSNFIRQASKNRAPEAELAVSEEDLNRLAKREINGRQIKNTMSNAQSIALETESPFSIVHIDTVLEVMQDWNLATKSMLGV